MTQAALTALIDHYAAPAPTGPQPWREFSRRMAARDRDRLLDVYVLAS